MDSQAAPGNVVLRFLLRSPGHSPAVGVPCGERGRHDEAVRHTFYDLGSTRVVSPTAPRYHPSTRGCPHRSPQRNASAAPCGHVMVSPDASLLPLLGAARVRRRVHTEPARPDGARGLRRGGAAVRAGRSTGNVTACRKVRKGFHRACLVPTGRAPEGVGHAETARRPRSADAPLRRPQPPGDACAVEPRTTSSGWKTNSVRCTGVPPSSSSSALTAAAAIARTGWRTVVSGGSVKGLSSESS